MLAFYPLLINATFFHLITVVELQLECHNRSEFLSKNEFATCQMPISLSSCQNDISGPSIKRGMKAYALNRLTLRVRHVVKTSVAREGVNKYCLK